jgi:hypothetical protein
MELICLLQATYPALWSTLIHPRFLWLDSVVLIWVFSVLCFLFWQKLGLFFVKYLRFFAVLDKKQFC